MHDQLYEATEPADRSPERVRWVASCLFVALTVMAIDTTQAAESVSQVEISAEGAPLARTLEQLVGGDGVEVRVSEEISDLLSGRLVGTVDDLVELLTDTHSLSMYRDGKTVWFDRKGRPVVDFVKLDTEMLVAALKALASPVLPGGTVVVEADNRGLVLSGTRAYVEASLARIALATGKLVPDFSLSPEQRADRPSVKAGAIPTSEPSVEPDIGEAVPTGDSGSVARTASLDQFEMSNPSTSVLSLRESATRDVLGARIILVSSANPQAVILADGRQLHTGATLPNGHRIVTIERSRLVLERAGAATIVSMP